MKIAVVHYHLNPGGVTRIIESQVQSLEAVNEGIVLTVLSGGVASNGSLSGAAIKTDTALNYWNAAWQDSDLKNIAVHITAFIKENIDSKAILHVHNAHLGKNPALTLAIYQMTMEGFRVVNHYHDFPEDRQENLSLLKHYITGVAGLPLNEVLYPDKPFCHFITLNTPDYKRIVNSGIPLSRVHLLPNPVHIANRLTSSEKKPARKKICDILGFRSSGKICTYPVRAIARKNLGEFILLAALFADKASFTVTQPPKNPAELPLYNRWKSFCLDQGIRIAFESGDIVDHEELISISDFCITTSTREGFGMAFLEPWLAGTPVIGRDLPSVTQDLKAYGIEFPRLYSSILVEASSGKQDFKDLDPVEQELIIREVIMHSPARLKLYRNNPFLAGLFDNISTDTILKNQKTVEEKFSLEQYGKELLAIYREVSQ
jgi:glycosyltransferase involved in cell wall biosynthesis